MEIRRLDTTQFLLPNEKVHLKVEKTGKKIANISAIICYFILLISLTGNCFLVGVIITLKQNALTSGSVNSTLLPLSIAMTVLSIIPFIFWYVYATQNKTKNDGKWYVLTDRRLCVVTVTKTIDVVSVFYNQITAMKVNKKSVNISVSEEKITLNGLESASSFGAKLEALLSEVGEDSYNPLIHQAPESTSVKAEDRNEAIIIKATQPAKVDEVKEQPALSNESITEQIEKVLQDYADKVLNSNESEEQPAVEEQQNAEQKGVEENNQDITAPTEEKVEPAEEENTQPQLEKSAQPNAEEREEKKNTEENKG